MSDRNNMRKRLTLEEASADFHADALPSEFAAVDRGRMKVVNLSIFDLQPDATQPRRAFPLAVREMWTGNISEVALGGFMQKWVKRIGITFPTGIIERGYSLPEGFEGDTISSPFYKLVDLASSIFHNDPPGLINPITVTDENMIDTGERRWWAYVLLYFSFGENWKKIPARKVSANAWRQAAENMAREDLNAIQMSRQLAKLTMAAFADAGSEVTFEPYEAFESDREFYAQILDARKLPSGYSEKIAAAMGFSSRSRLSEYRKLLQLDDETWQKADDESWSYRQITGQTEREKARDSEEIVYRVKQSPSEGLGSPPLNYSTNQVSGDKILCTETHVRELHTDYLRLRLASNPQMLAEWYVNHEQAWGLMEAELARRDMRQGRPPLITRARDVAPSEVPPMADTPLRVPTDEVEPMEPEWWAEVDEDSPYYVEDEPFDDSPYPPERDLESKARLLDGEMMNALRFLYHLLKMQNPEEEEQQKELRMSIGKVRNLRNLSLNELAMMAQDSPNDDMSISKKLLAEYVGEVITLLEYVQKEHIPYLIGQFKEHEGYLFRVLGELREKHGW